MVELFENERAAITHEVRRRASPRSRMRIKISNTAIIECGWRQWNAPPAAELLLRPKFTYLALRTHARDQDCTLPAAGSVQQKIGSGAGIWDLRSRLCCLVLVNSTRAGAGWRRFFEFAKAKGAPFILT